MLWKTDCTTSDHSSSSVRQGYKEDIAVWLERKIYEAVQIVPEVPANCGQLANCHY